MFADVSLFILGTPINKTAIISFVVAGFMFFLAILLMAGLPLCGWSVCNVLQPSAPHDGRVSFLPFLLLEMCFTRSLMLGCLVSVRPTGANVGLSQSCCC
jgi:hypothetical protein